MSVKKFKKTTVNLTEDQVKKLNYLQFERGFKTTKETFDFVFDEFFNSLLKEHLGEKLDAKLMSISENIEEIRDLLSAGRL